MELVQALDLLKTVTKPSTALDEFVHIDFSLIAADKKELYQKALMIAKKAIKENEITKEEFEKRVGIKKV